MKLAAGSFSLEQDSSATIFVSVREKRAKENEVLQLQDLDRMVILKARSSRQILVLYMSNFKFPLCVVISFQTQFLECCRIWEMNL